VIEAGGAAQQRGLPVLRGLVDVDRGDRIPAALEGGNQQVGEGAGLAVVLGDQGRRGVAVEERAAGLDVVARRHAGGDLAQDDVDGAGDRLAARLGGGHALDLDAFDQVRADRLEGEAGGRRHAVQQDQHIAAAHAAHADRRLAAGRRIDGDAGLAPEDVGQAGVALAQQFLAADDDGGGGRLAAQVDGGAGHLDLLYRLGRRRRGLRGGRECRQQREQ